MLRVACSLSRRCTLPVVCTRTATTAKPAKYAASEQHNAFFGCRKRLTHSFLHTTNRDDTKAVLYYPKVEGSSLRPDVPIRVYADNVK